MNGDVLIQQTKEALNAGLQSGRIYHLGRRGPDEYTYSVDLSGTVIVGDHTVVFQCPHVNDSFFKLVLPLADILGITSFYEFGPKKRPKTFDIVIRNEIRT